MLGSEGHLTVGSERGKLEVLLAVEVSFAVGLPRGVDSCEETSLVEEIKVFSLFNCVFLPLDCKREVLYTSRS